MCEVLVYESEGKCVFSARLCLCEVLVCESEGKWVFCGLVCLCVVDYVKFGL